MNKHARLGWTAFSAQICAGFALVALLSTGCSDGNGGSGGSTSSGGSGGTTASGGAGGTGGATGGTGGAAGPTCESVLPDQFSVRMAVNEEGQPPLHPDNVGPDLIVDLSGTVSDVGSGPLTAECDYVAVGSPGAWLTLNDADGKSWHLCYTGTGAFIPLAVGDAIDLHMQVAPAYLAGFSYQLTLRRAGALMLLAFEDNAGLLTLPDELSVVNGDELCITEGDFTCTEHGFRAVATSGGDQAEISPGESGIVGGFNVHLGRWSKVQDGGGCDAGSTRHHLFATPAP